MKKTSFILALVILAMILAGCQPANVPSAETTVAADVADTVAPDNTVADNLVSIVADGKSDYMVLRADLAPQTEVDAAVALRNAIDEAYGVRMRIGNEIDAQPERAIIVGNVNYGGAAEIAATLGYYDYVITFSGEHIVICGGSPEATRTAVNAFMDKYLTKDSEVLAVPEDLNDSYRAETLANDATIGGESIKKFTVFVSSTAVYAEKRAANSIRSALLETLGINISVNDRGSAPGECAIIIGNVKNATSAGRDAALAACGDGEGIVYFEGTKVYITGKDTDATCRAVEQFVKTCLSADNVKDGVLTVPTDTLKVSTPADTYTVMSFNLLVAKESEPDRFNAALTQINAADPDILGVQECSVLWYEFLCGQLGDRYAVVGELNHTSTQMWRNAIFYKKDKFELIETKTQWLSATPSTSSRLTNETQYRILTYAVLKDVKTGATFAHCNTHMTIIEEVRESQFKILVKLLGKLDYPIVMTGDFNTREGTGYYQKITDFGLYSAHVLTSANDLAPTVSSSTIDFCFVDPAYIGVVSHEVIEETVGGVEPSDHNAVVVKFRF
ncbi:MAG: endonuclease/exonuclease/phosphatase family protein, partial [Clostridia bacterium]|nr:endonuclease/exonuclease/phosphatase family protein [Clostridia bacterium]